MITSATPPRYTPRILSDEDKKCESLILKLLKYIKFRRKASMTALREAFGGGLTQESNRGSHISSFLRFPEGPV